MSIQTKTGERLPAVRNHDARVLKWTLAAAVTITTVIASASFVLSFASLWDLATRAGLPRSLSWLWPVIVDGTILQATVSVIALATREEQRPARRFFWTVLSTAAVVSVSSNALHAFIVREGSLQPALAAAIATVAPVSLLASTHGIALLTRVRRTAQPMAVAPIAGAANLAIATGDPASGQPQEVAAVSGSGREFRPSDPPNWSDIARNMQAEGLTTRPHEELVEILKAKFQDDRSNREIGKSLNIHHATVGRVVGAAQAVLRGSAPGIGVPVGRELTEVG